jgi:flagellar basal body rod protein FlgG
MNINSVALGGLQQAEKQLESISSKLAQLPLVAAATGEDTVDLSAAMVGMAAAENVAQANLQILRTSEQMNGQIVNLLA